MRIFMTGGTGLIGRRVVADWLKRGDEVVVLSRDRDRAMQTLNGLRSGGEPALETGNMLVVEGDPSRRGDWQREIAGCDAIVHLAGAPIADRRWSRSYKQTLYGSRITSTRRIVEAIERAEGSQRPRVFISGSAIGYYGDAGDRELDESAPPGSDFLARLCVDWEHEAMQAKDLAGSPRVRVVLLRTGIVLDDLGGALQKMLLPFRLFAGGPIASGRQWMSWIHWRDMVGIIDMAIGFRQSAISLDRESPVESGSREQVAGALNAVSPNPVRNRDFARTLGRVLGRPSFLPAPKFALRIVLGEVAGPLTSSQRVIPARAEQCGYQFQFPELEAALRDLLPRR